MDNWNSNAMIGGAGIRSEKGGSEQIHVFQEYHTSKAKRDVINIIGYWQIVCAYCI